MDRWRDATCGSTSARDWGPRGGAGRRGARSAPPHLLRPHSTPEAEAEQAQGARGARGAFEIRSRGVGGSCPAAAPGRAAAARYRPAPRSLTTPGLTPAGHPPRVTRRPSARDPMTPAPQATWSLAQGGRWGRAWHGASTERRHAAALCSLLLRTSSARTCRDRASQPRSVRSSRCAAGRTPPRTAGPWTSASSARRRPRS